MASDHLFSSSKKLSRSPVYTIDPDDLVSFDHFKPQSSLQNEYDVYEVYYYDQIDMYKSMVVIKVEPNQDILTVIRYTLALEHAWWSRGLSYPPLDLPGLFPSFIRKAKEFLEIKEEVADVFEIAEKIISPDDFYKRFIFDFRLSTAERTIRT